jgi:uncharacterized membrane protein
MKKNYGWLLAEILLVVLMYAVGIYFYDALPALMPSHWGINGTVDSYASKNWIIFGFPLIALVMIPLFRILKKIDPYKEKYAQFVKAFEMVKFGIIAFFAYMYFVMIYATFYPELNVGSFVIGGVGILFMLIGNYMGKVRQNYFMGIRTPWTLQNEEVWNKTHRLGGWCFFIAGLIFIVEAFVFKFIIPAFVFAIVLAAVVPMVYSYVIYKSMKKA